MDELCGGGGGRTDEELTAKNSRWDVFLRDCFTRRIYEHEYQSIS